MKHVLIYAGHRFNGHALFCSLFTQRQSAKYRYRYRWKTTATSSSASKTSLNLNTVSGALLSRPWRRYFNSRHITYVRHTRYLPLFRWIAFKPCLVWFLFPGIKKTLLLFIVFCQFLAVTVFFFDYTFLMPFFLFYPTKIYNPLFLYNTDFRRCG